MRTWLRRLAIGLGALLALPIAILVLALLALQFAPVRNAAKDQLLGLLAGSIQGKLEVDDLRWPSLRHIELSGVRLHDRHGQLVGNVGHLSARLRIAPLLSGSVSLSEVSADGLFIDLGTPGADHGLLSVFESKEPPPPEPPPEDSGSAVSVKIDKLCLEGKELRIALSPDQVLALRTFSTCAFFEMAENIDVRLDRLRAEVLNNGDAVLVMVDESGLQPTAADADDSSRKDRDPGEVARGWLHGKLQIAGEKLGFAGKVELREVSRSTLEALGVDAEWLTGSADLSLSADGDASHMRVALELRAEKSRLRATGELLPENEASVELASDGLELARFTTIATERLTFGLGVKADLSKPDGPRIVAKLVRGSYGAWALPEVDAKAAFGADGSITVSSLEARYPSTTVLAQGKLGADGAIDGQAQVNVAELAKLPPLRASLPGWAGQLHVDAKFSRAAKGGGMSLDANASIERLRADSPALGVESIALRVTASGSEQQPTINAKLFAKEVHFQDQRFAQLSLSAQNAPEGYLVQGNVDGDRANLDIWIQPKPDGLMAGGEIEAKLSHGELRAVVKSVQLISGRSVEIAGLSLEHLGATVTGNGSLGLGDQPSRLHVEAEAAELSPLMQELASSDLRGQLRVVADLEGSLERPKLDLKADFRDGPRFAGGPSALSVQAQIDGPRGQARVRARAAAGPAVVLASLDSNWRRSLPLSAALNAATHELDLQLEKASIGELISKTDTQVPFPLAGSITAQVKASGTLKQLDLAADVAARVKIGNEPNLDVKLRADYGGGGLGFKAEVHDVHGALVKASWHQETRVESFLQKPPVMPEWLGQTHWEATVDVASRRLAELPTIRTQKTARDLWALRSQLSVQLAHRAGDEPTGEIKASASWDPLGVDPKRATCSQRVRPSATLEAKLREGLLHAQVDGKVAEDDAFRVRAQLGSTLEEWLEGKYLQITRARIDAEARSIDLAQWPVSCEQGAGIVTARFAAENLFDKRAKFAAKVEGRNIVFGQSLPLDFSLQGDAAQDGLDVAMMIDRIGGQATIRGSVPISFRVAEPPESVNWDGPLALDVVLSKVDVRSLLAVVPGVARPSGFLDGQIKVGGKLGAPRGSGAIDLRDVSMTLPELGQRFTKVNGRIAIHDNKIKIPELEVRDQTGKAKFSAELALETIESWKLDLKADFDDFPVRKEGVLIGRADAAAKVQLNSTKAQTDVDVKLRAVSVTLTGDTGAEVQSLDDHPEIVVAGEEPVIEDEAENNGPGPIINVHVRTEDPLWVRRDDFAVRMRTDLGVHVANGKSSISGEVKIERGYISLLGQQFDVKDGRVLFTGGQEVNPRLELTAQAASPSGESVRVEVTGYVSKPELAFFLQDRAVTAGDALKAITGRGQGGGGDSDENAANDIASAAMGMTTGLLSLGARREFGDFIPMLSVEQNTDETRVRAGFEADKLIPKFARGFVKGAYVEGVVSSGDPNARGEGGGNAEGGVLLELMLPADLVWAGQYGPGQTWSLDLDWRP